MIFFIKAVVLVIRGVPYLHQLHVSASSPDMQPTPDRVWPPPGLESRLFFCSCDS